MKHSIKKLIALVLCAAMLFSVASVAGFAAEKKTDCGEDCEFYPTIIVPGLGQSNTWVLDENGDFVLDDEGNKISSFPAYIQIPELIKEVAGPLLLSLMLQKDVGLSKALSNAIYDCFSVNACDNEAQPGDRVFVLILSQNTANRIMRKSAHIFRLISIPQIFPMIIFIISHTIHSIITSTFVMNSMNSFRWLRNRQATIL